MKLALLVAVPPGVVTLIGPLPAVSGTRAVTRVADTSVTVVAATPPKLTEIGATKFVPVIATTVFKGPELGENDETVGAAAATAGELVTKPATIRIGADSTANHIRQRADTRASSATAATSTTPPHPDGTNDYQISSRHDRCAEFHLAGDAILVLSDDAAHHRRPAVHELQAMQQAVIQATRCVEVEVLEVVTPADLDDLKHLRAASDVAEHALRSLIESSHVIDADYMARYESTAAADEAARSAYLERWRELFNG